MYWCPKGAYAGALGEKTRDRDPGIPGTRVIAGPRYIRDRPSECTQDPGMPGAWVSPGHANLRLVTHFRFFIVGPDQKTVTKRP